ncbi:MAG: FTR1 family protein [Rickettsiaceae bacterium]|nr:FTR1 family protein [Rickettsiaceae bacterium]
MLASPSLTSFCIAIFRESMEISLLLGIILAATDKIKNSRYYITIGIIVGVISSSLIAVFLKTISDSLDGLGQEVFDACVCIITVITLGVTVCWIQNRNNIFANINNAAKQIHNHFAFKLALITIVATSIFREGAEILLIAYSFAAVKKLNLLDYVGGVAIASAAGLAFGALIYKGLLKFARKFIFELSSILLIMVAASIAAEAVKLLLSCGVISVGKEVVWDLSSILSDKGYIGSFLKTLVGYNSRMTLIELIVYISVFISLLLLSRHYKLRGQANKTTYKA